MLGHRPIKIKLIFFTDPSQAETSDEEAEKVSLLIEEEKPKESGNEPAQGL